MTITKAFPIAVLLFATIGLVISPNAVAGTPASVPPPTIFVANSYAVTAYSAKSRGDVPPIALTTDMAAPVGLVRDSLGRLYVANSATNTITVYPPGANGNVPPLAVIGGSNTFLADPSAIAIDASGKLYVLNTPTYPKGVITVYPPLASATGIINEAPIAIIAGAKTQLDHEPSAIALDTHGKIYVATELGGPRVRHERYDRGQLNIFAAGSNGNVAPIAIVSGDATGLSYPIGLALDSDSNIYVSNGYTANEGGNSRFFPGSSITVYAAGSEGNVPPTGIITGGSTGLEFSRAIALDSSRNLYLAGSVIAANGGSVPTIDIYPADSFGNVAPATVITGVDTGLIDPISFALDSTDNLYALNSNGGLSNRDTIVVYPSGSSGDQVPTATITSSFTGLDSAFAIATDALGSIFVTNELGGTISESSIGSITTYPPASYATSSPQTTITGPDTGLYYPFKMAINSEGDIAVLNGNDTITQYSAGSSGDAVPISSISVDPGDKNLPVALAMDSQDRIYLLNATQKEVCNKFDGDTFCSITETGAGSVSTYRPNSDGEDKPSAVLAGPYTNIASPSAIALDHSGNIYVANQGPVTCSGCACFPAGPGSITAYPPAAYGNERPITTISGANTQLAYPTGIAVDRGGNIYVLNSGGFGAGACFGAGFGSTYGAHYSSTRFGSNASGLDYTTNSSNPILSPYSYNLNTVTHNGPILIFATGSNGNVAPIASIGGPLTSLHGPASIAVSPPAP